MRFAALATDYDGTLADEGIVSSNSLEALRRLRRSGRYAILVTGRILADLETVFPNLKDFDCIVAENGATFYDPATGTEEVLADAPPPTFFMRLQEKGTEPLDAGRIIISTVESQKEKVLDAIHELGLELQIIFNKGSLMILPSGANKATGLEAAAGRLSLSLHNIAGIGDAENDHAFLSACEFPAAVANALPALKERVQLVTKGICGAGVVELIDEIVASDLGQQPARLGRPIPIGTDKNGRDVTLHAAGVNLILGTSGGGKSTATTAFLEALASENYQFCIIDPEGDYETLKEAVVVGTPVKAPTPAEVVKVLEQPSRNAVANLLAVDFEQRPPYLRDLFRELNQLRNRLGRPHCIVVDEAHHFVRNGNSPAGDSSSEDAASKDEPGFYGQLDATTMIALRPERLPRAMLDRVDKLLVAGQNAAEVIASFCSLIGTKPPSYDGPAPEPGEMLAWENGSPQPVLFCPAPTENVRIRHRRKYAEGELAPERSFYFRGPENKLNLRAHNLITFLNLMEGVDDSTWLYHLRNGEYSKWFREQIKDDDMAAEAELIEHNGANPGESRERMHQLVTGRYTLPG